MKLLYDRVLLEKIVEEEHAEGILKHHLSEHMRISTLAKGKVIHIGVNCQEVKVGDVVVYKANLERFLPIDGKHLVEIRESNIEGILETK
jgi:co-chaperonin GroES (HSP10)